MFELTGYYLVSLDDPRTYGAHFEGAGPQEEVTTECGRKIKFPEKFLRAVRMEGSGRFGGDILNYDGSTWRLIDAEKYPWGRGATGEAVVPFSTMAADPKVLALRKTYVIRELRGIVDAYGQKLTGVVRANDTGGRIKGRHVDLYVGTRDNWYSVIAPQLKHCVVDGKIMVRII